MRKDLSNLTALTEVNFRSFTSQFFSTPFVRLHEETEILPLRKMPRKMPPKKNILSRLEDKSLEVTSTIRPRIRQSKRILDQLLSQNVANEVKLKASANLVTSTKTGEKTLSKKKVRAIPKASLKVHEVKKTPKSGGKKKLQDTETGKPKEKVIKAYPKTPRRPQGKSVDVSTQESDFSGFGSGNDYDSIMYDPKDRGCLREGLRKRRMSHPWWIHDGTEKNIGVLFKPYSPMNSAKKRMSMRLSKRISKKGRSLHFFEVTCK